MFKNENGFSLVELAIAAGLAVALAATAVTVLSGTTANLSSKANGAAGTSTTYNSNVLANASGAAGSGSQAPAPQAPAAPTVLTFTANVDFSSSSSTGSDYAGTNFGGKNGGQGAVYLSLSGVMSSGASDANLLGKTVTITMTSGYSFTTTLVSGTFWGTPKVGFINPSGTMDSNYIGTIQSISYSV